ncbi:MAG TPA: hypothetical protein VGW38_24275 [Chloroflexota bacterium]|nr:hypothetical protein [Chloroflexota bacterium]
MRRRCTVCTHPDLATIDEALVSGAVFRAIAQRFALSEDALKRHKADHLSKSLAVAQQQAEIVRGDALTNRLAWLDNETVALFAQAKSGGQVGVALLALREYRANTELRVKVQALVAQEEHNRNLDQFVDRVAAVVTADVREAPTLRKIAEDFSLILQEEQRLLTQKGEAP